LAKINIKIDYYDDFFKGEIDGRITDGGNPVPGAKVSFYNRKLLVQTSLSDNSGYYSAQLPPGEYKISAQKDSFYVTFYGRQKSPYNAMQVYLKSDSVITADIVLTKMGNSGISVSGQVYDSPSGVLLRRGIVVLRPGTHTPSKLSASSNSTQLSAYSAIIQYDGTYRIDNISETGYYFVQALSDYYVPGYYNNATKPAAFWQKADSISISSSPKGINIYMSRDSAYGDGNISGKILLNNSSDTSKTGVTILVQSLNRDSSILAYALMDVNGNFNISNLKYGKYQLRAQKIGLTDIYSGIISIDSVNNAVDGIEMNFDIAAVKGGPVMPLDFQLSQNYPNPFNPTTSIKYFLPYGAKVFLHVINVLGQEVSILEDGYSSAGSHTVLFNGSKLASGIYFVNLTVDGKFISRKIVLLK
jgi:hypothetical protein